MSDDLKIELDDRVLTALSILICGDDGPYYRSGIDLRQFFRGAGWKAVSEFEGPRGQWTTEQLRRRSRNPDAMRQVLLRLADPREYIDEPAARTKTVAELNTLLAVEGLEVRIEGGNAALSRIGESEAGGRPLSETPLALDADLAAVVGDLEFGAQLSSRLDEARACWTAGAPTAAVIMLGSLLEGVLFDVVRHRSATTKEPNDHLETLIDTACAEGWIARDVADYAHVLRKHRNLVHPRRQWKDAYAPADATVRIAWNVVVAALNDLATARGPKPPS